MDRSGSARHGSGRLVSSLHTPGAANLSIEDLGPDPHELADRRRLEEAAGGDRDAFAELVESHSGALLRFLRALTGDDAIAEDVLQETFLAALRGAAGFRGEGRVRAWLFTIARNKAMRHMRARPESATTEETIESLGLEAGWGSTDDPESAVADAERRALLERALAGLSPEDRVVITLHDLDELSGPETAHILGVSLAATKSRLHRARLRLMAALRRERANHA
ncbi:MAG TPA: RNA polymerase sigma factor [Deltaproteobacteria bacterium]|nr:RNA polymerase sigma factor [Deltaproteobacteria bacterium]